MGMSERFGRRSAVVGLFALTALFAAGCASDPLATGVAETQVAQTQPAAMPPVDDRPAIELGDGAVSRINPVVEEFDLDLPSLAFTRLQIGPPRTYGDVGAGQGVEVRDGLVYLYGDADTGIICEYAVEGDLEDVDSLTLAPTGRVLRLTKDGEDLLPHPTGLTFHPEDPDYPTVIGDTVAGQGVIWFIDWEQAWEDGNLDNAVIHSVLDTAAVNGTRPEFAHFQDEWYVLTSDYGDTGNQLRFYSPDALRKARTTSDPGVLVLSAPCGPYVQTIHWHGARHVFFLVQNQVAGLRYRLGFWSWLGRAPRPGESLERPVNLFDIDLPMPDELEGFHWLPNSAVGITFSAFPEDNTYFIRFGEQEPEVEPEQ